MNKTLLKNILLIFKLTSLALATISAFVFLFSGVEGFLISTFVIYALSFASFAVSEAFDLSDLIKIKKIEQKTSKKLQNTEEKTEGEAEQAELGEKPTVTKSMVALSITKLVLSVLICVFSVVCLILY